MFSRRTFPRLMLSAALLLSGTLTCSVASATEVCVNSASALFATLVQASVINQPYTVKIVQGTYAMPGNLDFDFVKPIAVQGGYTTNCASRVVDVANTVINVGAGHTFVWNQYSGSPTAEINVEGLTFSNATNGMSFQSGTVNTFSNDEGSVRFKQVRFTGITDGGEFFTARVRAINGEAMLENVLFDHFTSENICVIVLDSVGGAAVNINHMTADLPITWNSNDGRICIFDNASNMDATIYNSILWSSTGANPIFGGVGSHNGSTQTFVNDLFHGAAFHNPSSIQNQINANPLWINPSAGNYRLQNASPAVNSGTLFPPNGEPATDIEGHARIIGSAPDRGAYESLVTDQTTFIVSNTNDSGAGSLRDAITLANNNLTQKLIKFDIRNQANVPICPAVIALTTVLPIINSRMTIDGYTQPTSTKNTAPDAFNANLCVIIKPASGTLTYGFTVPANSFGSLALRGVGLGGFIQPVRILGGQSSQISGSQFGGTANGIDLPGAGINAINFASGASGNILVGGNALGDRNVIGNAAFSGVESATDATTSFTTCQIVNNIVGLAPNGISALPNNTGINVTGSGCQVVGNRTAGNTYANLWVQGSQHVVQQNQAGFNIQGAGFLTNAIGILVTGSNNIIGAGGNGGSITANTVRSSFGGGVVVQGNAATGNSINANRIYDNGAAINRMDIDLIPTGGVAGPTPNDAGDGDTGPNDLQNFPVLKGLFYTAPGANDRPGTVTASLDTLPGTYRVDVYFSNDINPNNKRGHAEIILTHVTVQVPGSGKLSFSIPISVPNQSAGGAISMTATNSSGSTSEISTALSTDVIFADGVE